jgi:hypothetical protein
MPVPFTVGENWVRSSASPYASSVMFGMPNLTPRCPPQCRGFALHDENCIDR